MSPTVSVQGLMGEKSVRTLLAACKEKYLMLLWEDAATNKIKKLKFSLPKNRPQQNTKVCSTEESPPEITWKMIHYWHF